MTTEKKAKKPKVEFNVNAHSERLAEMIQEAEGHLTQIESLKEMIKEIRDGAKAELGLEGKEFNKMLKIYFKRERDQVEAENDEILEKYDAAFPRK
ncbi:DsbA [Aeromonas phage Aeh1]|uniref:DsbA n=1 Tax=Aeromonas phage Aeh1 TaxID=2880362 RepID=Q76YB4_9CAUD|nr:transcriptional regulator [Aeromonas phage Aeh1]AAQ17981.1 DsbA [Aeromonas phage Aeh1]